MKKLNKKGNTLIELIISIALMSIVLVFLMHLLIDLNNTNTNNKFAKNNQINRTEIIKFIEQDLNKNTLTKIEDNSTSDTLIIKFLFKDNKESTITATNNTFTYENSENNKRLWTMKDATINTKKATVLYREGSYEDNGITNNVIYTLQIDIGIYTKNDLNKEKNNNLVDDILLSYYGKTSDFTSLTKSCLGYNCNN